jgi:predicted transcriptional regulator of viral defense system
MNNITDFLTSSGGYARMKELRAAGFQTRDIADLVSKAQIERVKPGLYRLAVHETSVEKEVCRALPDGVICLMSALDYHGLTTFNPPFIPL